jgi:hypothetical protein
VPYLTIRAVNSVFEVTDQGGEYPDVDSAYEAAVKGAVAMAAEEIAGGKRVAIIETCIEDEQGKQLTRGVVSVATARLQTSNS